MLEHITTLHITTLISREDNEALLKSISKEDIWNALVTFSPNKALGLDGFSTHFYHKCLGIVKEDAMHNGGLLLED